MNDLSWLIYAADVAGSVKNASAGILTACGLAAFGSIGGWAVSLDGSTYSWENKEEVLGARKRRQAMFLKGLSRIAKVASVALVFMVITPSSSTIYAIAASEMGESVLKSETGGKAVEALNAWLDRQIAPKTETTR